jgi:hypothetical protein
MLPSFSRGLRLALVLALSAGVFPWYGLGHSAYAAPKGGGDEEEDSDDSDDSKDTGPEEGDDPDDKDQPAVTAGGLFTLSSYPVNELLRPLTMTRQITQLRLGLGTDVSDKGAFGSAGVSLEAQHGYADNFTIIGGLTSAYNFKQFGVYAGFEGGLLYDVVDIRLAANLHRSALARYCDTDPMPPANCGTPPMSLPDGNYDAGNMKFSLDLGFPFRYAFKPEIAIVALQTLMSIDFNEAKVDHVIQNMDKTLEVKSNGVKPDLNPSVGVATNPIPALSVVVFGQLRIVDFDTSAGAFQIPVTARVEFSPSQKLDIGLEFTLLNVKPPEPQKPFDNRFVSLFLQSRFGK